MGTDGDGMDEQQLSEIRARHKQHSAYYVSSRPSTRDEAFKVAIEDHEDMFALLSTVDALRTENARLTAERDAAGLTDVETAFVISCEARLLQEELSGYIYNKWRTDTIRLLTRIAQRQHPVTPAAPAGSEPNTDGN